MEGTNIVKSTFGKTSSFFLKLAAISTAALAVVNVYSFYRNNIWHPKVVINSIDYANGVANLTIDGKKFVLRGDSTFLINFDWGIRFGFTFLPDGKRVYDRIEITKRGMVHEVVREANSPSSLSFTGFNEQNYWNDAFNQYSYYGPTDSVKR
jgi:hypothetical protein